MSRVGLVLNLSWETRAAPEDKSAKSIRSLEAVLSPTPRHERKAIEKGVGLLNWESELAQILRQWLAPFYGVLNAFSNTLLSVGPDQLPELSESLAVMADSKVLPAQTGWRLLAIGNAWGSVQSAAAAADAQVRYSSLGPLAQPAVQERSHD